MLPGSFSPNIQTEQPLVMEYGTSVRLVVVVTCLMFAGKLLYRIMSQDRC